jgi:hypothetical protein
MGIPSLQKHPHAAVSRTGRANPHRRATEREFSGPSYDCAYLNMHEGYSLNKLNKLDMLRDSSGVQRLVDLMNSKAEGCTMPSSLYSVQ